MVFLRCYLLAGLVAHKVVWEVLKRRHNRTGTETKKNPSRFIQLMLVKSLKIGIFLGLMVQTVVTDVLPVAQEPFILRAGGVVVYTAGLLLSILARIQLGENWTDIETAQVLSGHVIVSNGLYRYIRHPIYVGDLLLLLGFELSLNSWLVVAVGLITPVVLWKAVREEEVLVKNLPRYADYRKTTKRFIPFVI